MNEPQKYLVVTMPDGSEWAVPVTFVANDRARYYARQKGKPGDPAYEAEYAEMYDDTQARNDTVYDWAPNELHWSDVATHAVPIKAAQPVDYEDGWANGEKRIVSAMMIAGVLRDAKGR